MDWENSASQQKNMLGLLGIQEGDNYIINKDCLVILEKVLRDLINEDRILRTCRRTIGFGEHIRKDLLPLLLHVKNFTTNESSKIINTTIKILQNLTIPVECLLPLEQESKTESGRQIIYELNCLLLTSKEIFTDSKNTRVVVDFLKSVVEVNTVLNLEQLGYIENCFQLLRNVLHIPEAPSSNVMQNQIIWNLFTQNIDKTMIHIMTKPEQMHFGVTMVQIIALMYKHQSANNIQKLLNFWLETSISESSEDNESNTSPKNMASVESSVVLTSDPTSDPTSDCSDTCNSRKESGDNESPTPYKNKSEAYKATEAAQNRVKIVLQRDDSFESNSTVGAVTQSSDSGICNKMEESVTPEPQEQKSESSNSELKHKKIGAFSDLGYNTQVENERLSISTSSNDDETPYKKPVHQKPLQKSRPQKATNYTPQEKKEMRRKKLLKRGRTNIIHMKGMLNHKPTDEDVNDVLKEFTVDFLLQGYAPLVENLYHQLLSNINLPFDNAHFFWLVTYFLKFAAQLEIKLEKIKSVLSFDIISYLVFQAVWQQEELEVCRQHVNIDLSPILRRLHLVVTSIKEFLETFEAYQNNSSIDSEERNHLITLELQISEMHELKNLFVLLLREYNPDFQSKQYLRDLIVANHDYLLLLEKNSKNNDLKLNIEEHLREFATSETMRQYGSLLEDFNENGKMVNNCIFTMMHHVSGDLENLPTLFQFNILKSFSSIWDSEYELCDDWIDLIEYIIQSFVNHSKNTQFSHVNSTTTSVINNGTPDVASEVSMEIEWNPDEYEPMNISDEASQKINDKISNVIKNYDKSNSNTNQNEIKKILEANEIDCMTISEDYAIKSIDVKLPVFDKRNSIDDDVKVLRDRLNEGENNNLISWLQATVLEAYSAKLMAESSILNHCNRNLIPPITYYYTLVNLPVPLVTWTSKQYYLTKHNLFALLLSKLNFLIPRDMAKIYVRIPSTWSANYLYSVAAQLGPIDTSKFEETLNCILKSSNNAAEKSDDDDGRRVYFEVEPLNRQGVSLNNLTPVLTSMDWYPVSTVN